MANQIIDNLLASGAIMRGTAFKDLSSKFQDVLFRRKVAKKTQIENHQSKEMRQSLQRLVNSKTQTK
jgi:hypothetical protein